MGCYGNALFGTKSLDRMAAEGARLTEFHAMPTCTPARGEPFDRPVPDSLRAGPCIDSPGAFRPTEDGSHSRLYYSLRQADRQAIAPFRNLHLLSHRYTLLSEYIHRSNPQQEVAVPANCSAGGCNSATQRQNCVKSHGRSRRRFPVRNPSCAQPKVALVADGFHSLAGDVVPQ